VWAALFLVAAWFLVAFFGGASRSRHITGVLVAFTLSSGVVWLWIDEMLSFPRLRRFVAAGQAGVLVASFLLLFVFLRGVIDGYGGAVGVEPLAARTLTEARSGFASSLFSPRTAAWALVSLAVWRLILRLNHNRALAASEALLRREAEDAALRARLAPHFIFNALNTLKAQIELAPSEAAETADRLASLFRQVLALTDRPTIPLRDELAFVEAYLGIERARLGSRLRVTLEVAEALEAVEVPSLSLQVLVENAVKHGIAPREEGGEVLIWARWNGPGPNRRLLVGVESPRMPGAEALPAASGTRTGLQSLRGRLESPSDLVIGARGDRYRAEFSCRGLAA
jgi:sensor histidine kinase YesM